MNDGLKPIDGSTRPNMAKARASLAAARDWTAGHTLQLGDGAVLRPDKGGGRSGSGAGWVLEMSTGAPRYYRDPRMAYDYWREVTGHMDMERPEYLDRWAQEWPK